MKARKVKGLRRDQPLDAAMERIVRVRLDELCGFMPRAADAGEVEALHDMRIAAKRLRYVLELTHFCFGPYAAKAAKRVKELQDLVGEIHDCDVTLPRVLALQEELREADATVLVERAGDAEDLDPSLSSATPHATAYRGLETVATHLRARRDVLHARFLELWAKLEREGFRPRLEYAIAERPQSGDFTARSQDGG